MESFKRFGSLTEKYIEPWEKIKIACNYNYVVSRVVDNTPMKNHYMSSSSSQRNL